MPAPSPGLESITSQVKPRAAPQRRYIRSSICAQSCASVPPAPAWMSRNALCESISPRNMRFSSRCRTSASRRCASRSMSRAALSSPSARASSRSSAASPMPLVARSISPPSLARRARSRPSSCARAGFDQTAGSSSSRATSSSRSRLRSYSKKPPQRRNTFTQILEVALELIDFHTRPGPAPRGPWRACTKVRHANTAARSLASGRQHVIDEQLQAPFALVLVHFQPVHELGQARGWHELRTLLEVVEGNCIEGASAARHLHPHLHVPLGNDARAADAEQPIEARLGESLAPRAAGAQGVSGIERDLRRREPAVGFDGVGGGSAGRPAGNLLVERPCEAIELGTLQRKSPRPRMTAQAL